MSEHILKILLIEDNPADIAFIEEMLSQVPGYRYIITVTDRLTEGLDYLQNNNYDIVITDVSLPDNDGLENIDKLKKVSNTTPIILLTGLDDIETGRQAVVKGAQDFLTKGKISSNILSRSINYSIERKQIESDLNNLNSTLKNFVQYDSLTGVINRKPFIDQLENNIARAARNKEILGILYIDIENFKYINDTYGHETGDKVLKATARKLKNNIRQSDIIGRLGGDEFAICLNNINSINDAVKVAVNINKEFYIPFVIDNLTLNYGVSIGIALYPNDGLNASILLNNSDIAMYKSKQEQRNGYHIFNKLLKLEQEYKYSLNDALNKNEFTIKYQPIFDNREKPVFIEALLRWETDKYDNKSSMCFIPLLEENGSIVEIGWWFLEEVCKEIKALSFNSHIRNIPISVNLSPLQIEGASFVDTMLSILHKNDIYPGQIIIELTGKRHFSETKKIRRGLKKLKAGGIGGIVLDDFGSEFSTFTDLINFPIDIVKFNSIHLKETNTEKCRSFYSGFINLFKNNNIKIVAKNIETHVQYEIMSKMGCDYYQGYFLARPQINITDSLKTNYTRN